MSAIIEKKRAWLTAALCIVLVPLGVVLYSGNLMKTVAFLAGAGAIWAVLACDAAPLRSKYVWPLLGYVLFAWLTAFWALSLPLFLEGYLQIFTAAAVFLILLLRRRFDADAVRRVLTVITVSAAAYGFLGVEEATTGLTRAIRVSLLGEEVPIDFNGIRLFGVFGNPNVEASLFCFGVILSIGLLCGAQSRRARVLHAVTLGVCAHALLLTLSLGALFFFAIALVVYLVFAAEQRGAVLARMLSGAVPTLFFVLLTTRFAGKAGMAGKLPLLLLLLNAAVCVLAELHVAARLSHRLETRQKLLLVLLLALVAVMAAGIFAAVSVHRPHTFGESITRVFYPSAGTHTLSVDADGAVQIVVDSQNKGQMTYLESTVLYQGSDGAFSIDVPADALVCRVTVSGAQGTTVRAVTLDGKEDIPLDYPLLPGALLTRLQELRSSQSVYLRRAEMSDGLKLWQMRPLFGNGVGAFEAGHDMVRREYYVTKYAHSNYVQTLLETGVVGFILWFAALIAPAVALWKKRKDVDHPLRWAYGALCAALTMTILQPITDVCLSFCVYLWYAYALFATILRGYAIESGEVSDAEPASRKKRPAEKKARLLDDATVRAVVIVPVALFLLTVCGNGAAHLFCDKPMDDLHEQLSRYQSFVRLDLYESAELKYDYVNLAARSESATSEERIQAAAYAHEIEDVHIPIVTQFLSAYYYTDKQYEKAILLAKRSAEYYAANTDVRDSMCQLLRSCFDRPNTPLLTQKNAAALMDGLLEYRDMISAANARLYHPIALAPETEAFFAKIEDARAHADDAAYLEALFAANAAG